jgi:hypothetical protein
MINLEYKKIKFLLFTIIFFISCSPHKSLNSRKGEITSNYKILKIDSVNSYYFIYVTRDKIKFKIVSKKEISTSGDKIKVGKKYALNLISMLSDKPIKDLAELPQNRSLVSCYFFDDSTKICYEKSYNRDLYKIENLKGLYLIKSN